MKALRYGISCLLVAGFAFVAACGGSADDGEVSAGAAGGKTSTGGRSGAGTGSTSGGATGFPNNPACPAAAPADASACTLNGGQTTCEYSGMSCRCARAGGGMFPGGTAGGAAAMREWECTATLVCPATKPSAGAACTPAPGSCRYAGMGSCSCSAQSSQWSCTGGGGPGGGTGGSFNGFGGGFSFGGSFSVGGGFSVGGSGTSNPGGGSCPATKPTADSACTGDLSCPYSGGGCVCSSNKWTCL